MIALALFFEEKMVQKYRRLEGRLINGRKKL